MSVKDLPCDCQMFDDLNIIYGNRFIVSLAYYFKLLRINCLTYDQEPDSLEIGTLKLYQILLDG